MIKVGRNRDQMLARLDRMTPGDMPDFEPAMKMARSGFSQAARRGRQAHDHHQRRRPVAAQRSRQRFQR